MNRNIVRRCWIISSLFDLFVPSFVSMFAIVQFIKTLGIQDEKMQEAFNFMLRVHALGFGASIIGLFILFYCAYKKRGTKFLTFTLAVLIINIPYEIYPLVKMQALLNVELYHKFVLYMTLSCLVNMFSKTIWCFLSLKLRKLNKEEMLNQILESQSYKLAFEELFHANDLQNLDEKYYQNIRRYPEIYSYLKQNYKKRKLQIKQA